VAKYEILKILKSVEQLRYGRPGERIPAPGCMMAPVGLEPPPGPSVVFLIEIDAVRSNAMPPGSVTRMTPQERWILAAWLAGEVTRANAAWIVLQRDGHERAGLLAKSRTSASRLPLAGAGLMRSRLLEPLCQPAALSAVRSAAAPRWQSCCQYRGSSGRSRSTH
jgi:hypothetical protein